MCLSVCLSVVIDVVCCDVVCCEEQGCAVLPYLTLASLIGDGEEAQPSRPAESAEAAVAVAVSESESSSVPTAETEAVVSAGAGTGAGAGASSGSDSEDVPEDGVVRIEYPDDVIAQLSPFLQAVLAKLGLL